MHTGHIHVKDKQSKHILIAVQRQKRVYRVLRWQRMQTKGTGTGTGNETGVGVVSDEGDDVSDGIECGTGSEDILFGGRSNLLTVGLYKGSTQ